MIENLFSGALQLQNLHPLFVHFPLAFWPGAVLLYLLAWALKHELLAWCAFLLLLLATFSSAFAVATGLSAEHTVQAAAAVHENLMEPHERLMLVASGLGLLLTLWAILAKPFPRRGRPAFAFLLLILLGVLAKGADFGGRMVYEYNLGGKACAQPIEFRDQP